MRHKYFDCRIGDVEVEVCADVFPGSAGSFYEPPSGPEIDIISIKFNDRDITATVKDFDSLIDQCMEQLDG